MQQRRRPYQLTNKIAQAALLLAATASSVLSSSVAQAQTFPFPSSNAGGNGRFTTSVLTAAELESLYDDWKANFIGQCGGGQLRVVYPENNPANDTRSEGIGYGMVIAAYMGDQATFEGLRNYYFAHLDGNGLMNWFYLDCNQLGPNGQGSASDADVDAAFGLIVANRQWPGEDYDTDAATLVGRIRGRLFLDQCPGILLAGSDNGIRNCGCVNPSYIPTGYYPAFGATEPDQATTWNQARTLSYTYFANASNNQTGLVPAWSNSGGGLGLTGCNPIVSGGGAPSEFQADAARTPWRVATDFLWTGNASAAAFLGDIADFAKAQRIVHIVDRYQLGGAPLPGENGGNNPIDAATLDATGRRSSFTMGGFATAMMSSSQDDLDRFTGAWQSMYLPGDNVGQPRAFGSSLAILYGLLVTGYMWDPTSATNPTLRPPPPPTPPIASNLLENGDFDEGMLGWAMENIGGVASEGFAMHKDGEMHLLNQKVSGVAGNQWHLRLSQLEPVAVQAGQRYRLSVTARADEPRLVRMVVAQVADPFATYLAIDDDAETDGNGFTVGTTMQTYEVVVQSAASDAQARFAFELADSVTGLVIDNVIFEPTDAPLTVPGAPISVDPVPPVGTPTNPDGTPATPGAGGTGTNLGPVDPNGDPGSPGGLTPVGAVPGANGGLPPVPTGRPNGNGTCTVVDDPACAGFECSVQLGLCYEPTYGYVWDASANAGQGGWTQPPTGRLGCGEFVYLPTSSTCYDPETGYLWNPQTNMWQYWGDFYTAGQDDTGTDSACAVGSAPVTGSSAGWMLVGLLGAAGGLAYRRRRA